MSFAFATCERHRALEFLKKLYPSSAVEDTDAERYGIRVKPDDRVSTFGGEACLDDCDIDDYGLSVGDFSLCGLTSAQMADIAKAVVGHMSVCGHAFSLSADRDESGFEKTVLKCNDGRSRA